MQSLSTRPVVAETLEQRIEQSLSAALDKQAEGGFESGADRGLAARSEDCDGCGVILLSIEDVARIAAAEARAWF